MSTSRSRRARSANAPQPDQGHEVVGDLPPISPATPPAPPVTQADRDRWEQENSPEGMAQLNAEGAQPLAEGGDGSDEGPELVGEQGPELVTLPDPPTEPIDACRVARCQRPKWIGDICREHYAQGATP